MPEVELVMALLLVTAAGSNVVAVPIALVFPGEVLDADEIVRAVPEQLAADVDFHVGLPTASRISASSENALPAVAAGIVELATAVLLTLVTTIESAMLGSTVRPVNDHDLP